MSNSHKTHLRKLVRCSSNDVRNKGGGKMADLPASCTISASSLRERSVGSIAQLIDLPPLSILTVNHLGVSLGDCRADRRAFTADELSARRRTVGRGTCGLSMTCY